MNFLFWLSIGFDRRTPSEHLLVAIIEALCEQGHVVHVLQKDTGGPKAKLPAHLVELGVTTTTIKIAPPKKSSFIARYLSDISYVKKCKKWLRRNSSFDRVFLQSSNVAGFQTAALQKYLKNIPVVFNVQDIFPENAVYSHKLSRNGVAYRLLSAVQKRAYRYVQRIITISEDMKDQLVELGVAAEKIEVIYNWSYADTPYDRATLDYSAVAPFLDKSKFNVVYAGNLGIMQNVELVLRAAEQIHEHDEIAFHIFGDGIYRSKLRSFAERLKLENIFFHDMLDASEAPALYASADLNVIPLAENIYRTALPSKTATCLACGKPIALCIGTASRFAQGLIAQTNVSLLDPNDVDGLAKCILATQKKRETVCSTETFQVFFSKTKNSRRYAELLIML